MSLSSAAKAEQRYEHWRRFRGLRPSIGICDPWRLAGGRGRHNRPSERWQDHARIWIDRRKAVCYTAEPYDIDEEQTDLVIRLAQKLQCVAYIREPGRGSLWYPKRTWLVEIWAPYALNDRDYRHNRRSGRPAWGQWLLE